jgi:hypothetical protein
VGRSSVLTAVGLAWIRLPRPLAFILIKRTSSVPASSSDLAQKNECRSLTVLPKMGNRSLLTGTNGSGEVMARRVGIIGIGIMGTAMMRNLVKDGFEVVGYDIAEVAMARLVESGGIAAGENAKSRI